MLGTAGPQWLGARLQAGDSPLEVKVAAARVLASVAVGSSEEGLRTLEALRRTASPSALSARPDSVFPALGATPDPAFSLRSAADRGRVTSPVLLPQDPPEKGAGRPRVSTHGPATGVPTEA
jgi:hypothetical protein